MVVSVDGVVLTVPGNDDVGDSDGGSVAVCVALLDSVLVPVRVLEYVEDDVGLTDPDNDAVSDADCVDEGGIDLELVDNFDAVDDRDNVTEGDSVTGRVTLAVVVADVLGDAVIAVEEGDRKIGRSACIPAFLSTVLVTVHVTNDIIQML